MPGVSMRLPLPSMTSTWPREIGVTDDVMWLPAGAVPMFGWAWSTGPKVAAPAGAAPTASTPRAAPRSEIDRAEGIRRIAGL